MEKHEKVWRAPNGQKLYIPLMNSALERYGCDQYVELLSELDVHCVFIALDRSVFFLRDGAREAAMGSLKKNVSVFKSKGYTVGVWIQAFGFGDLLCGDALELSKNYTPIRSVMGKEIEGRDMFCPENENFSSDYLDLVGDIASVGVDMLMLDDDYCLSVRPGIGCFCERHIALLEKRLRERLDPRELSHLIFTGGANKYRDAYLSVMGETLKSFAKKVSERVASVDPELRVGVCAGYTSFDVEGADALTVSKILAGKNRPFMRLTGAPYWAAREINRFEGQPLSAIVETARSQERYCRASGIEIFFEADSYPRPRYAVPSSLLECFSLSMYASGGAGELSYLFDYHSSPKYETGYLKHRLYNREIYNFLDSHFFGRKRAVGVRVYDELKKLSSSELDENINEKQIMRAFFNRGSELLSIHAIPSVYGESSDCGIAFGEDGRHIDIKDLPRRLIIDAKAAMILKKRGLDVGFSRAEATESPAFEMIGDERILLSASASDGYYKFNLSENAVVLGRFESGGVEMASSYLYKSGGTELLVYTFDVQRIAHRASILTSYARGKQLRQFCKPPVSISDEPYVYVICKSDENETAALIVNMSEDPIIESTVELDREYSSLEICGACGTLTGNSVKLDGAIPPYGAVAIAIRDSNG